jgi:pimeloyl-ACP methyl ester carboxylesterase
MLARPDSHADLAQVRVPTLVVCGCQDPVTPLAVHEAMASLIPAAQLVVIEDCGHLSAMEQPESLTSSLSCWIGETA